MIQKIIMGLIAKVASPSKFASIARTILKMGGTYLLTIGFSEEVVNNAVESLVPIIAGGVSVVIGMVASNISADKK